MMPRNVAKSGTGRTLLSRRDDRGADADAEQGDADRQAHGEHRAERDDQDDDGEGEAEHLGRRLLELGEDEAAELDLAARRSRGASVEDLVADLAGAGERDVVGQLDVGVGDLARRRGPATRSAARRPRRRGSRRGRRRRSSATSVEQTLHRCFDLGVVDALLGPEHDRADLCRCPGRRSRRRGCRSRASTRRRAG